MSPSSWCSRPSDVKQKSSVMASLALLATPAAVSAYPQYIAKGYTNCGTCHYSPTGGGLLNSYGHASAEAAIPDVWPVGAVASLRQTIAKNDVTGFDEHGRAALQWDVGVDTRLLFLRTPQAANAPPEWTAIPMLVEAGAVLALGRVLAYGTVTPRRPLAPGAAWNAFSREHWLQVKLDGAWSLRAGRLVLPFGLRIPDHTEYTREDFGFDKYDQTYAVEVDDSAEDRLLSVAIFAGDLVEDPWRLQERGAVLSLAQNVPGRATLGVSLLGGRSELVGRGAVSFFSRVRLWGRSYTMGELAGQWRRSTRTGEEQLGTAGLFRGGWFARESLDVYVELGGRAISGAWALTKLRYLLGANWQVLPWVEIAPAVFAEEDTDTGLSFGVFGQLHIIY